MKRLVDSFNEYFEVVHADSDALRELVFRLRYQVYCVETKFEDASTFPDELERDAYDVHADHTLLIHRATGWIAGTVRLALVNGQDVNAPFPAEVDYPGLFSLEQVSGYTFDRANTAEVSRFAVSKEFRKRHAEYLSPTGTSPDPDYDRRRTRRENDDQLDKPDLGGRRSVDDERKVVPHITLGLIQGLVNMSVANNVDYWCAAMEPTLLRLLARVGIRFHHIGPLIDFHGKRQPCIVSLEQLLDKVYETRDDVWEVLTNRGAIYPRYHVQESP